MHSIRKEDDKRGSNKIRPNTKALALEDDVFFLTETEISKLQWDIVVTNPRLGCKDGLF